MQRIERSIIIHQDPLRVWDYLTRAEAWKELTEAFAGRRGQLRVGKAPPDGRLRDGSEVEILTRFGRSLVRWRLQASAPGRRMELLSADPGGWLAGYQVAMSVALENPNPQTTVVSVSFVAIFLNRFIEILSLFLPRFLYGKRLDRALQRLREAL